MAEDYDFLKHGDKRFVLNERLTEKLRQEKENFDIEYFASNLLKGLKKHIPEKFLKDFKIK